MQKVCKTCHVSKEETCFPIRKRKHPQFISVHTGVCISCSEKRMMRHRKNREKNLQKMKEYYRNNKKILQEKGAEHRNTVEQKQKKKEYDKQYRLSNLERKKDYNSRTKERRNKHLRERRNHDVIFKARETLRTTFYRSLRRYANGDMLAKKTSILALIGCSLEDLKQHIETQFVPGMSWENWGTHGWHIDHIRPCASFDLSDQEQQKMCFHYTNLRPLWAKENISKGKKFITLE